MDMKPNCTNEAHFHASLRGSKGDGDYSLIILGYSPEKALEEVLSQIKVDWQGSIEIYDDETSGPSDMPLLDYWKD